MICGDGSGSRLISSDVFPSFWLKARDTNMLNSMVQRIRGDGLGLLAAGMIMAVGMIMVVGSVQNVMAQEAAPTDAALEAEVVVETETAETEAPEMAALSDVDTLWTCLAAFLVFFMQAGFALVETGFTRAKNACNILMKNVMDLAIGSISFWIVGFGLMFGVSNGWIGTSNFFYEAPDNFQWSFLLFQTVFCATAATIVSGAMAERTKFVSYLCYTVGITVIVYPIFGGWAWGSLADGGGWLEGGEGTLLAALLGPDAVFHDFAGSTVVHSIGGWCALAGAIMVGARKGKYSADGRVNAIPGHNIPIAALGVFILWLGWFGFNPGSTTAVGGGSFAFIAVTTNLSGCAGSVAAMITSWILFKKPDPSFALNGALAGLVGITAGCDAMTPLFALITGAVAGVLVVFSVMAFDRLKIDDPVGAISVHGVCGAWGTLAIGLFQNEVGLFVGGGATQFLAQIVGIAAAFLWAFPISMIMFAVVKATIGLRVSEAEEAEGLDIHEHGMFGYPPSFVADGMNGVMAANPAHASAPGSSTVPKTATVNS